MKAVGFASSLELFLRTEKAANLLCAFDGYFKGDTLFLEKESTDEKIVGSGISADTSNLVPTMLTKAIGIVTYFERCIFARSRSTIYLSFVINAVKTMVSLDYVK